MKIYKIRNKKTGLFSMGGMDVLQRERCWRKTGKVWKLLSHLKNHLRLLEDPYCRKNAKYTLDDLEIVEYTIVETSTFPIPELE